MASDQTLRRRARRAREKERKRKERADALRDTQFNAIGFPKLLEEPHWGAIPQDIMDASRDVQRRLEKDPHLFDGDVRGLRKSIPILRLTTEWAQAIDCPDSISCHRRTCSTPPTASRLPYAASRCQSADPLPIHGGDEPCSSPPSSLFGSRRNSITSQATNTSSEDESSSTASTARNGDYDFGWRASSHLHRTRSSSSFSGSESGASGYVDIRDLLLALETEEQDQILWQEFDVAEKMVIASRSQPW